MPSNKTIRVARLLKWANTLLSQTNEQSVSKDQKMGVCSFIEQVLHETNNYNGFGFQSNADSETGSFGYYTRYYYVSNKIRKDYEKFE